MPELNWLGDRKAKDAAKRVPYRLLEPMAQVGDPAAGNLLIQGDNLDALKSLLPLYAGRVKCIFIDPPYNTRSAFEHYDDNLEHSQWLSMMYPRLELLRELLAEDGSIWVTIDDNEGHYLKVMMDEVFGRKNFVANVVWQKKYAVKNDSEFFSESHDHILVYAKNGRELKLYREQRSEEQEGRYKNPDDDSRGAWTSGPLQRNEFREYAYFAITGPSGREHFPPKGTSWRYTKEKMAELIEQDRIWFGASGNNVPRLKRFLAEVAETVAPTTWWDYAVAGHNDQARREAKVLTEDVDLFGTPKPELLVRRILTLATNPNDLVLDSFLGSGTTAAVAHKMGRRWIGIEMGEHARTHCLPRLTKVVEGEQGGISSAVNWQGGGGFRFMRLGEPVFEQDGRIAPSVRFAPLAAYLWFAETRVPWERLSHAGPSPQPSPRGGEGAELSPLLGVHGDTAIVLLYNGILGDRRPQGGNVLTHAVWQDIHALLPDHTGSWLVYGEASRLQPATLKRLNLTFKQIPYDIRVR
ncbi:MAG: site-specific DNA-methyltransferase [Rhodanobacter sp.]|nr:MAG: site-specific DNA-methyltransferase [Rhodanobacter sp.]